MPRMNPGTMDEETQFPALPRPRLGRQNRCRGGMSFPSKWPSLEGPELTVHVPLPSNAAGGSGPRPQKCLWYDVYYV